MRTAINSFCRQLNAEAKLSCWSAEAAIHPEFVLVPQMLSLFHNRTGIYDWATNLFRLQTDQRRLKPFSSLHGGHGSTVARSGIPGDHPHLWRITSSPLTTSLLQVLHLVGPESVCGSLDFTARHTGEHHTRINGFIFKCKNGCPVCF